MTDEFSDIDQQTAELMLFVAGELSPQKMQQMRARLQTDSTLRQKLSQLKDLQQQSFDSLQKLDETDISEMRDRTAVQYAQKAVSQWSVRRLMAPPRSHAQRQIPWSRYAVSAAAAIILTGMAWPIYLSYHRKPGELPPLVETQSHPLTDSEKLALMKATLDNSAGIDEASDLQFASAIVKNSDSDTMTQPEQQ